MSEKKVVRRSVANSLGIVCIVAIIFIAALGGNFASYVESHHHTDDEYNSLQSQVYELNKTAGQVTLKPSDDTFVDSENPNSNYGETNLAIFYFIEQKLVWLKFDLSSVPNGAVVDNATLQLCVAYSSEGGGVYLDACSCSNISWTEMTLTYSNMPSYNTTPIDSILAGGAWYSWSIGRTIRNALNNNAEAVTIILSKHWSSSSPNSISFYSKENPSNSPKLTIHWSEVLS